MKEIWKAVVGYEGKYEVSNLGRVASLSYDRTGERKILTPNAHPIKGHYRIVLYDFNGKRHTHQAHRLVAEAFIPNPDNLPMINHKDEDPTNNRVNNLEWCDAKYNNAYGTRMKKVSMPIIATFSDGTEMYFESMTSASRYFGASKASCISECVSGKYKTAYGCRFRKAELEEIKNYEQKKNKP